MKKMLNVFELRSPTFVGFPSASHPEILSDNNTAESGIERYNSGERSSKEFENILDQSSNKNISAGKHLICDLKGVKGSAIHSAFHIREILDAICGKYHFCVLGKLEHRFQPQGFSLIYLLSESHISIHTFPEKNYIAIDIYTCRHYENNSVYEDIYDYLVESFDAERENPIIIDRIDSITAPIEKCADSSLFG